jgi:hypothetical protein
MKRTRQHGIFNHRDDDDNTTTPAAFGVLSSVYETRGVPVLMSSLFVLSSCAFVFFFSVYESRRD